MIEAKIVADSKNEFGDRITTMIITFPRIILAEFNTHRTFSRNSASSRAIPFKKMIKNVMQNPFIPIAWQKDHKGMQGIEYFTNHTVEENTHLWLTARDKAIFNAECLYKQGVTKQLCNRQLEPFMQHTVIVTATEWDNFFTLRCPQYGGKNYKDEEVYFRSKKDALYYLKNNNVNISNLSLDDTLGWLRVNKGQSEIHMMALAEAMWDAYNESRPQELKAGYWHIPFNKKITELLIDKEGILYPSDLYMQEVEETDGDVSTTNLKIKMATVMAARTSYTLVGEDQKSMTVERMIQLHDELLAAKHLSPFEHCAKAMTSSEYWYWMKQSGTGLSGIPGMKANQNTSRHLNEGWCGNFRGFIQYRKTIINE